MKTPAPVYFFSFFINDILNCIRTDINGIFTIEELQIFMLLFTDDDAVFAQCPVALQSILGDFESYCGLWDIKFNTLKTKGHDF